MPIHLIHVQNELGVGKILVERLGEHGKLSVRESFGKSVREPQRVAVIVGKSLAFAQRVAVSEPIRVERLD